jgi:phospholipid/cholesterol/gamma-HCH transport system substrate-binding protein
MIDLDKHFTEGLNRARLELEIRRSVLPLLVALVGLVAALYCAFYIAKNVGKSVYSGTRQVAFEVADARGVVGGGRQDLLFKGIPAGEIDRIELKGGRAVVSARMYDEYGAIYQDATATLRPNTALEDMTLDVVERGTRRTGEVTVARPLPVQRTDVSVQVEDVLQAFRPAVRANLGVLLRDLGGGLEGRGDDLRRGFVAVVPLLRDAARLSEQLTRRARLTRSLIRQTGTLAAELGRRDRALRTLVSAGGDTLRTLQRSGSQFDATLAQLPPTLKTMDSSFAALRDILPEVDGALSALQPAAQRLPAGLTATRRLADAALPAARRLRQPVRRLVPLSESLGPLSTHLSTAVARLRPQIPAFDYATRSVAGCSTALQGFFQWTPSVTKFHDARGPSVRGDFALGVDGTTFASDPNVRALPSCAPGVTVGGEPGPGGNLEMTGSGR